MFDTTQFIPASFSGWVWAAIILLLFCGMLLCTVNIINILRGKK